MKVLYLTTMYPIPNFPQQGIFCHEQVKALVREGVEVTVVVPVPFYNREIKVKEWVYEGIKVKYVRFFKFPGARDFHRTGKNFYRALRRKVNLNEFDLYHADAALPSGYATMIASKKYGKPFIVHGHGLDVFLSESYAGQKNCYKIERNSELVYKTADAIAGVSQKVLDNIQKRVDIKNKSYVVFNGVDTDKFYPIEGQEKDKTQIITIGNLIPLKGHEYTLQAIKKLVDCGYKNISLKILGRGYLEESLKRLTSELDIEDYVDFKGYLPYEEVAKSLQNSDIFVLPSYYEALGCVYLEAMACGIPTIGCYENGIDEIIKDKETGFLVQTKNVDEIFNALVELMDENKRKEIGANARKAVVNSYQWKHSAEKLKKVYDNLIKGE